MVEVYSMGDAQFLWKMFNAAARLRGTGSFAYLGMIGSMMGMFLVFWRFISTGGKEFPLQHFLVGLLVFTVMFKPTVDVAVHQVVPTPFAQVNEVYTTDDVPVGVAIPMAAITGIGHALGTLFDTNLGSPAFGTLENGGFGGAIEKLTFIRKIDGMVLAGDEVLSPLARSLVYHLEDCVRKDDVARSDSVSQAATDRFRLGRFADVISVQSEWFTTKTLLAADGGPMIAGEPELVSCTESTSRLQKARDHENVETALNNMVTRLIPPVSGRTPQDQINEMFRSVSTDAQVDMRDYTLNAVTRMLWESAQSRPLMGGQDVAAAIMLESASQQRQAQWVAEESMFLRILRPITTFFEAFVPALAPLMAMFVMLGPFGISLVARYFLLSVWVALWLPLLTITSAFGTHSMERFLVALDESGRSLTSVTGIHEILIAAQDWMATAGLIGSATPMLALSILYGGAYTATALASRLQGGDHVNEKLMSPDPVQPAAAVQMSPEFTHAPLTGAMRTSADSQLPVYSTRSVASTAESNARVLQEQANIQVSETFGNSVQENGGWNTQAQQIVQSATERSFGQNWGEATSLLKQAGFDVGSAQRLGLSNAQIAEVAGQAAAGLPANLLSAQIQGMLKDTSSVSRESINSFAESLSQSVGRSSQFQAQFGEGLRWSLGTSSGTSFTSGLSASNSKQLSNAVSAAESATRTYQASQARSAEVGSGTTLKTTEAAQAILDSGMGEQVYEWAQRANFAATPGVNALEANLGAMRRFGLEEGNARVAAALMTLNGDGHAASDGGARSLGYSAGEISNRSELLSRALGVANASFMNESHIGSGSSIGRDSYATGAASVDRDGLIARGEAVVAGAPHESVASVRARADAGLSAFDGQANSNQGLSWTTLADKAKESADDVRSDWVSYNEVDRARLENEAFQRSAAEYDRDTNWMGTTWGVASSAVTQPFKVAGTSIAAIAADIDAELGGKPVDLDFGASEFGEMRRATLAEETANGRDLFAGHEDAATYYGMLRLQGGTHATDVADTIASIPGENSVDIVYQDAYREQLHSLRENLREENPGLEVAVRQAASLQNPWSSQLADQYRAMSERPGQ